MKLNNFFSSITVVLICCTQVTASETDKKNLVKNFCMALQAQSVCDDLLVHAQTENTIEQKLGSLARGRESKYNEACMEGINEVIEQEKDPKFCAELWKRIGCYGTEIPGLIMESPFGNSKAVTCKLR